MSDTDIRAWARDNGVDLSSRGPVPRRVREQYEQENGAAPVEFEGEGQATVTLDTAEVTPATVAKPTAGEKVKRVFKRGPKEPGAEVESKRPRKRAATSTVLAGSWIGLANVVARAGFQPVGICMSYQAPVAGELLEQATKGTIVDKVIQPFARTSERGRILGALIGPPLIVAAIQQRPQLFDQLAPLLESALYTWVEIGGPVAVKKAEQRAKREAEYGEDVKAMMEAIFAPLIAAAQAEQQAAAQAMTEPEGRPRAKPKRGPGGQFQKQQPEGEMAGV